jgi:multiple sugar transport system ATP-binding protein
VLAHVEIAGRRVLTDEVTEVEPEEAMEELELGDAHGDQTILVGRFDAASEVRPGHIVDLAVDTDKLQFFDLETGSAIRDEAQ